MKCSKIEKICLLCTLVFFLGSVGYFTVHDTPVKNWVLQDSGSVLPIVGEEGPFLRQVEIDGVEEEDSDIPVNSEGGENDTESKGVEGENTTELLDINRATLEELCGLPNIGDQRATDIIEYRESVGAFSRIEDIMNVSGIGSGVFSSIEEFIMVE